MPEEIGSDDPRYPSEYGYARSRQLEGTYPEDAGCWNVTWQRVRCGWGSVTQEHWRNGQPEPPSIDEKAKSDRTLTYFRIRNSKECTALLDKDQRFGASFEIWEQWYDADDGMIEDIPEYITPNSSHNVEMWEYVKSNDDPATKGLIFRNSWGLKWGHSGYGIMSLQYFDDWLVDSWLPISVPENPRRYIHQGVHFELYQYQSVLGIQHSGGWLYDSSKDDKVGWFSCRHDDSSWDVEELYVKPEYRGRGYARALMLQIKAMAEYHSLPLRLWVPYADSYEENHPALLKVASFLGLDLDKAPVKWAGYVGKPGPTPNELPSIRIPATPKSIRDKNEHPQEPHKVIFPDELEEYLWSRKGRKARIRKSWEDD